MEGSCKISIKVLMTCLVFGVVCSNERRVSRSLIKSIYSEQPQPALSIETFINGRARRQAPPFPTARDSNDQFIPRIDPPPPGSILTYNGKPIATNIAAYSIVPKSERKTPSININRPQFATYRGDLPPPIPDVIPRDLPQFKNSRSIASNVPPGFQNK